ncbi:MAG TPA: DUF4331 domain-containing protein [Candidatus Dormibacteraeota bacterium]|nr:DUF4331 domain-containing protein [Candidatus Dormibacteraeota bacterium]
MSAPALAHLIITWTRALDQWRLAFVRKTISLLGLGAVALGGLMLSPSTVGASSHREAPLIASDPTVDNTDVYAFVSPDRSDSVTLIANWIPFEEPNGGPNFFSFSPDAYYDIHIDNTGSGRSDITYRWTFSNHYRDTGAFLYNTGPVNSVSDPTLNFYQTYTLTRISAGQTRQLITNAVVAPSNVGPASMPNYGRLRDQAISPLPGGGSSFAGQADDPFFLDLRIFDLLYGGNLKEVGHDTLAGYNVNSVALQLPRTDLVNTNGDPVIGVWSTTERVGLGRALDRVGSAPAASGRNGLLPGLGLQLNRAQGSPLDLPDGNASQVSRLGSPLVNEVVVPLTMKDAFNASQPSQDSKNPQLKQAIDNPLVPSLIQKIYGIPAPATPRTDLEQVFLTGIPAVTMPTKPVGGTVIPAEELRLNTGIAPSASPKRMGVLAGDTAGFPNGRRLGDDVVDIELQALEGVLLPNHPAAVATLGDGVNTNDVAFGRSFPYLALPHNTAVNSGSGAAVQSGRSARTTGAVAAVTSGGSGASAAARWPLSLPLAAIGVGLLSLCAGVAGLRRRRLATSR